MQAAINLESFKKELEAELKSILDYWITYTQDDVNGGFFGKINHHNSAEPNSPKGSVLNARILWAFSAAFNHNANPQYLELANRGYAYISQHFIDPIYGGVYWTVDVHGQPLDTKKQVYAIAFTIYALSEYYQASNIEAAKQQAINLFQVLLEKSYDKQQTGYFEAFTREWAEIKDLRLSAKDANEKKSMNTHLHVLEAFSNLYKVWKNEELKQQIVRLINNFLDHIINKETHHLLLFFDENWQSKSDTISYGHDIEAAWLLLEAAETIQDHTLIKTLKKVAIQLSDGAIPGFDHDGGLYYEYEPSQKMLIKEKHWWVQAEAMVGLFNAWQISNNEYFLNSCLSSWEFIKAKILDQENGEWVWGILENGTLMKKEDKAGMWKCPYHNSRACMEIIRRIEST